MNHRIYFSALLNNLKIKATFVIMLMTISSVLFSTKVYGGTDWYLINDTGSEAHKWTMLNDEIFSTNSLSGGPSSGNGGSFYYFRDTSNDGDKRHIADARVERSVTLTGNHKLLSDLGQLSANFSVDYHGHDSSDSDWFRVNLFALNSSNKWVNVWGSGEYIGNQSWKTLKREDILLSKGTKAIKIDIYADRQSGSDLDVYLDNIKLWISDEAPPVMVEATVTHIKDYKGDSITLKDGYNWVNKWDTIYGTIEYNEPVTILGNLRTNILNGSGNINYGKLSKGTESSNVHEYEISLYHGSKLVTGDNYIKLSYNPESGPFNLPVLDLGGNDATYIQKPNIDRYKLKLDNASPEIITSSRDYEYEPNRTSIDIEVREDNYGTEQSPLTLTYHWEYRDENDKKVIEPNKKILISNTVTPIVDDISTTYKIKIDIPNGISIPPYQTFTLYAEVEDEARNGKENPSIDLTVNQKDTSIPIIIWDKSIHEDGSEVDISSEDDISYTNSRRVSFQVEDLESGIKEVKYSWTREIYNGDKSTIKKMTLAVEGNKYEIQGTRTDAPLEGVYYLNILPVNGTETEEVYSKAFYFDNQGPSIVRSEVINTDGNPTSVEYQLEDRSLHNKFLYTILTKTENYPPYEPVTEPNISEGIVDDGMWKALELDCIEGSPSGNAIIPLDFDETGTYKVVTRFYDEYMNYKQAEMLMSYDTIPPELKVLYRFDDHIFEQDKEEFLSNAGKFKKNHKAYIELIDESGIDWEGAHINWVDTVTGQRFPAIIENLQAITISANEEDFLNGEFYLDVQAKDYAGNVMDWQRISVDGNAVKFRFDNSPPTANISYYNEKPTNIIRFGYSELLDAYSDIEIFQYGISTSPSINPSNWIGIDFSNSQGEISYTHELEEGEWYLHIKLQDTLGNKEIICSTEPFIMDLAKPSGRIYFDSGYINKLSTALKLEIDEAKDRTVTFKTIISDNKATLEAEDEIDAEKWRDIVFQNGLANYGWELYDTSDGEQTLFARFMDGAGNISDIYEATIILDRTYPTGQITYDVTEATAGNVTATLTMEDNYNVKLLNNFGVSSYIFNRNGEFEFVIKDDAGNKTRINAIVDNIDKDAPRAFITYSHPKDTWTNESIIARLSLEDENAYRILSDGGDIYTFDENGEFFFEFEDSLGNQGSIKAEVKNIDKVAPTGSIVYMDSDTAPITVYLHVNEAVNVTNNGGSFRYIFDKNGEFQFEFEDKAGNMGTAIASVYTISSPEYYVNLMYDDWGGLTKENVSVEFTPNPGLAGIINPIGEEEIFDSYRYNFIDNGEHSVQIRLLEEDSNIRTVTASVYNIDRTPPDAEIYISKTEPTNEDVVVTLLTYDDRGKDVTILNNAGESEYVFQENGSFIFEFMDEAGNIAYKEISISNIDKSIPQAQISYETQPNKIIAKIVFPEETEEVRILNNNGLDTFEFVENGAFKFLYSDKAGNTGEITAQVQGLSDNISEGTIEYYIGETKIDNPDKMMINQDVTAKLILEDTANKYTIINNGGSSSYSFKQNGEFTFVYEDENSNRGFTTAKINTIDKEVPKLQIFADIIIPTNKNVYIIVSYSDNIGIAEIRHNIEDEVIYSEGEFIYLCSENKAIEVTVVDTAGNQTSKVFDVNYIDRKIPTAEIIYTPSTMTNKDVRAILMMKEPGRILTNGGKMEYIFTQNGEFTFEFEDYAGNIGSKTAYVTWMDKIPPVVSLEYSNKEKTNKPVDVTLKVEENSIIMNNGGSHRRTFYTNGEYTFNVRDEAGNISLIKAIVENIDGDKPYIKLKGLSYVSIFQNEVYIEAGYTAIDNVDGDLTSNVVVEGTVETSIPGIYTLRYTVSDAVGNISEEIRKVKVLSPGELVILINDEVIEGESIILNKSDVRLNALGNEGSLTFKWASGKRTQAYFKTGGYMVIEGESLILDKFNWYTFFVQDRERRLKTIQVYIND